MTFIFYTENGSKGFSLRENCQKDKIHKELKISQIEAIHSIYNFFMLNKSIKLFTSQKSQILFKIYFLTKKSWTLFQHQLFYTLNKKLKFNSRSNVRRNTKSQKRTNREKRNKVWEREKRNTVRERTNWNNYWLKSWQLRYKQTKKRKRKERLKIHFKEE